LILPTQPYASCSAAIKLGKFNEDLKKLFQRYPKEFAVRQKLAEIFIVQCDFTGKITQPSSMTQLSSTSRLSNPYWQNTTMCGEKNSCFLETA